MQRILICNESLATGGISTYTLRLATVLKARGWEVTGLVSTVRGEHCEDMRSLLGEVVDLSQMPLGFTKAKKLAQIANDLNPDILLLNHCALAHYALPMLIQGIKPVVVVHADVPLYYRTAARFPEHIFRWVCPSPRLAEGVRAYLPARHHGRIVVIPHGVGSGDDIKTSRLPIESGPRVIFVGHLGRNKGAHLLPAIFGRAAAAIPAIQFEVLGKGDLETELCTSFKERKLKVIMKGHVDQQEVYRRMASAHILVLPTEGEGFGLVVAEALHCGAVPVVSRLEGATDKIVSTGRNGLLVDKADVEGFAQAIIRLIQEPATWSAMSRAAVSDARERFSLDAMADRYERLFAEEDDRPARRALGPLAWRLRSVREHYRGRLVGSRSC